MTKLQPLALALTLVASAPANGLFGLGDSGAFGALDADTKIEVNAVPDAHWQFQPSGEETRVQHYSPNVDGLGFDNASRCYGHSLLSTRWFQYIVKPIKNGTIERITPEEFRDFWGGKMDYPVGYDITAANVDNERLQPYSMFNDQARQAIGKLVGYYHSYQSNLFDHHRSMYDDGVAFQRDLARTIRDEQLPPQLSLRRNGGGHAINAYKVEEGTAMFGNREGNEGGRTRAWKISAYDPNLPGSGSSGDDASYEDRIYMVVFEDAGGMVGFSEQMEAWYSRYLRQAASNPAGTWHIPDDNYGIRDDVGDDDGEIRSWHWSSISDDEAREIAGLESAD